MGGFHYWSQPGVSEGYFHFQVKAAACIAICVSGILEMDKPTVVHILLTKTMKRLWSLIAQMTGIARYGPQSQSVMGRFRHL